MGTKAVLAGAPRALALTTMTGSPPQWRASCATTRANGAARWLRMYAACPACACSAAAAAASDSPSAGAAGLAAASR